MLWMADQRSTPRGSLSRLRDHVTTRAVFLGCQYAASEEVAGMEGSVEPWGLLGGERRLHRVAGLGRHSGNYEEARLVARLVGATKLVSGWSSGLPCFWWGVIELECLEGDQWRP